MTGTRCTDAQDSAVTRHRFVHTVEAVCSQHLHAEPDPPSKKLGTPVPIDLEELLLACLAKDPADRPQSAAELQRSLRACELAGQWTSDDARQWWDEHGSALEEKRERKRETASALTIAIDLARRQEA